MPVSPLRIVLEQGEHGPLLRVHGVLDWSTAAEARAVLLQALRQRSAWISVDLAGVTRLDTAGLALLVEVLDRGRDEGHRLRVVATSDAARRMLLFARLEAILIPEESIGA